MSVAMIPELFGGRYRLLQHLGTGGMGTVYVALDRLVGQQVALKRVLAPTERLIFMSQGDPGIDLRLALAQEFKTLASLRHPNIISVLDYGFDDQRQPYFTMDLLEDAQTILAAGREGTPTAQIVLIVQLLQALAYLHRRGILHRDLKPANVLVVGKQVKVLDFGLSVASDQAHGSTSGTMAYMAPEVLQGHAASESADLYAVGVIAYELLTGRHPFNTNNISALINDILTTAPDLTALNKIPDIGKALAVVIGQLLAKQVELRYASAQEIIAALSMAMGQDIPSETSATRESFLQSARLVGRDTEMTQLSDALMQAIQGQGDTWLIAGESGVGKSRLLDELRSIALTWGVQVLRGQATSEPGAPYQLWREVLRWLCLHPDLTDFEAGVIQSIVPDVTALIGRDVPAVPELSSQAAHDQLLGIIADLLNRQEQPIMIILEDVHWAGSESLLSLSRLNRVAKNSPLLIIAAYRDDEYPGLPQDLPGTQLMKLERLTPGQIAQLSESMLGPNGRDPQVVTLLQRETEGNVFFMVEVVRALAEEAGRLEHIGAISLPQKVFSGGIQIVIRRRLNRVPETARPLLKAAAIAGRQIDNDVLGKLNLFKPNVQRWLTICADAAVLEIQEEKWRFAHDKLRETLLADLTPAETQTLNRQVAEATETIYADVPGKAATLAYHWHLAGDTAKEFHYSRLAGDAAFQLYANAEAMKHYNRAIETAQQLESSGQPIDSALWGHCYTRCGRAFELMAKYVEAVANYEALLKLAHQRQDRRMELLAVTGLAVAHATPSAVFDPAKADALGKAGITLARELGDRPAEAKLLWAMMLALSMTSVQVNTPLAMDYGNASLAIARELNLREQLAYTLNDLSRVYQGDGRFEESWLLLEEARLLWRELGNLPMLTDNLNTGVIAYQLSGEFDKALQDSTESYAISSSIGNVWGQSFCRVFVGPIYVLRGDLDEGITIMDECLDSSQRGGYIMPIMAVQPVLAFAYAMLGMLDHALDLARQSAEYVGKLFTMQRMFAYAMMGWLENQAGHTESVQAYLGDCLADLEKSDLGLLVGPSLWIIAMTYAEIHLAKGDYAACVTAIDDFLPRLKKTSSYAYVPNLLYYKGKALLALGQVEAAQQHLEDARRDAERMNARVTLSQILLVLSDLAHKRGNGLQSQVLRQQARDLILYIADHTGAPDRRASYLNQPPIKAILNDTL